MLENTLEILDKSILQSRDSRLIIGSPGCGKTTKAIQLVEEAIENEIPINRIGFVSFSVAAITEAISRVNKKLKTSPKNLGYFKTLHSLAFSIQGLKKVNAFGWLEQLDFAKKNGLKLTYQKRDDIEGFNTPDDKLMSIVNLSNLLELSIEETIKRQRIQGEIDLGKTKRIKEAFAVYKFQNNKFDYTDTIISMVENDFELPELDLLIVDEAQDLSRLQWKFIFKLASKAKQVRIFGDDKQCINTFAGADIETFLGLGIPVNVLPNSYRIPRKVHQLATRLINKITHKYVVPWEPRDVDGGVYRIYELPTKRILESKEDWLILARNKSGLTDISYRLYEKGIPFSINNQSPFDKAITIAITIFELAEGDETKLSQKQLNIMKRFIPKANFDVLFKCGSWFDAFTKVPRPCRKYIQNLMELGQDIEDLSKAKVKLNTIHASKGSEAENVIIINQYSQAVENEMLYNAENEYRVLFVGITRAITNLYILETNSNKRYDF